MTKAEKAIEKASKHARELEKKYKINLQSI